MKRLISATLALSMFASPMALAQQGPPPPQQGHGHENGNGHGNGQWQGNGHGQGHEQGNGHWQAHEQGHNGQGHHYQPPPAHHGGPGYGWHQGERVPPGQRYVVHDWHHHHGLYAPPPGHEWVQYNNQYFLVAVTSGVIGAILGAAAASQ
ncbi:MAG TPA: RcnB family protein [Acidisoma sp.]|jgi:Ni/Co efflux regulator RcnB|uniref:RcnB family protein n=1 Tax=Acidisoma sp. TaxID=1872115 RepID=UPI002C1BBCD7|nr:RcnB family protein [Acidisoma sp.]HTH99733.1 RcnB family protein [Acidisoma sp.]